jgi:acetolactate synthase-1/3 small subunit
METPPEIHEEQILSILVRNRPGVLSRVAGILGRLGYNIASLCVAETADPAVSRITLTSRAERDFTDKIRKHLDKLVDCIEVADYTGTPFLRRELMLLHVTFREEERADILRAIELCQGRILLLTEGICLIEAAGDPEHLGGILACFRPFGIRAVNRTGTIALPRRPS